MALIFAFNGVVACSGSGHLLGIASGGESGHGPEQAGNGGSEQAGSGGSAQVDAGGSAQAGGGGMAERERTT